MLEDCGAIRPWLLNQCSDLGHPVSRASEGQLKSCDRQGELDASGLHISCGLYCPLGGEPFQEPAIFATRTLTFLSSRIF